MRTLPLDPSVELSIGPRWRLHGRPPSAADSRRNRPLEHHVRDLGLTFATQTMSTGPDPSSNK
eukprot:1153750-Pyramimonas_sp.AAC.1